MQIGIMQGRLLPPLGQRIQAFPEKEWAEEFSLVERAGLDAIEWIYELPGEENNPLASGEGIDRIKKLSEEHRVEVRSVCADYFMDRPFLRATSQEAAGRITLLCDLLEKCRQLPVSHVVLPFVDTSRIENDAEMFLVAELLQRALPAVEKTGVELHLETSLPPAKFSALLERIDHPMVKVNYDSGNSASLGFDPLEEFSAYGGRIGSVHIKDRLKGGGTVALGKGDTDFVSVFGGLKRAGYQGDFILQVARDVAGGEMDWAVHNRAFAERHGKEAGF